MNQYQTETGRLRGIIRENEAGYADILQAIGREYDKALEQEQGADTDTRQAFCAGMNKAYKNALAVLSRAKEDA
jgi:UDP-N-acetylglucosamine:LPS N-acetylglucosamine transferase